MINEKDINRMIDNLVKEGLTRGEAYVKLRRMFVRRLMYTKAGSAEESRVLEQVDLLDSICLNR